MSNNFKLPKNFIVQLSGNYQSKTNLPVNNNTQSSVPPEQAQSASQGYIKSFYAVDAAIRKNFLKNNAASATLTFSDIFRTRKPFQHSQSTYFIQDYYRLRDPQMIKLTFTYRFGQMDMSLFKRKNMKSAAKACKAQQCSFKSKPTQIKQSPGKFSGLLLLMIFKGILFIGIFEKTRKLITYVYFVISTFLKFYDK